LNEERGRVKKLGILEVILEFKDFGSIGKYKRVSEFEESLR
jgi:hypothetical protein